MSTTNEKKDFFKSREIKQHSKPSLFSWLKFIVGILFSILIVYKLAISDFVFDFTNFDFNSLLSLILAIFAISLSVAFYFKATDTSNSFYDNTYKFTQDVSEILGRIEAGFGERLRHLDEGYTGLIGKFDNGNTEQNIKETKEELEKEKQKLKNDIEERNKILNSLIEKAQLEQHQKEEIRNQLKEKEVEISKQNNEINFLRNRLHSENKSDDIKSLELPSNIIKLLLNFYKSLNDPEIIENMPTSIFMRRYKLELNELSNNERVSLQNLRIINEDGLFTVHGIRTLREIVRRFH